MVGLECAVLERVGLQCCSVVESTMIPDLDEAPLGHPGAVIEDAATDTHAQRPPDEVLERRPIEDQHIGHSWHLPKALVAPKSGSVNRAESRPKPTEGGNCTIHENQVEDVQGETADEPNREAGRADPDH